MKSWVLIASVPDICILFTSNIISSYFGFQGGEKSKSTQFLLLNNKFILSHQVLFNDGNMKVDYCLSFSFRIVFKFEPRCEKTGLRGFRPGPTQTGL